MPQLSKHLAFEQAKQELLTTVNGLMQEPFNLELYELEIIIRDLYNNISMQTRAAHQEAVKAYNEAVKKEMQEMPKSEN